MRPYQVPLAEAGLSYIKAEANGNSFLLVPANAAPRRRWPELARQLCDRWRGVGADGVEFFTPRPEGFDLVLHNADGSEAEISGNGTRCAVAVAAARHQFRRGTMLTGAGPRPARVIGSAGGVWQIELSLGVPQLAPESIPVLARPPRGGGPVRNLRLGLGARGRGIVDNLALSIGNPHCCLFVERLPANWREIGAAVESHALFPRRTNVEFVRVVRPHRIEAWFYERGVGETASSGTGSSAAAVAAMLLGRARRPLEVVTPGGVQQVDWDAGEPELPVILRGPARIVAEGRYFPPPV